MASAAKSTAAVAISACLPPAPPVRLRLMCSYGGHIVPRPYTKTLFYAGGDTRIIAVPSTAMALSSFSTHLAATLNISYAFVIKYQLPHQDLDSLISVATDEDLHIMLEESARICSSRLRIFLFPAKPPSDRTQSALRQKAMEENWFRLLSADSTQPVLQHPKRDTWFVDVLRSVKIGGIEGQSEGSDSGGGNGGAVSGQETIVLETNSSFGSSSSSVSLSNLPAIGNCIEDSKTTSQEYKTKFPSPESATSDFSVAASSDHVHFGPQETDAYAPPAAENRAPSKPIEKENKLHGPPSSGLQTPQTVILSGYPALPLVDQKPQKQVQIIYPSGHYVTHNPAGVLPFTPYYPLYHPPSQQAAQVHFQFPQPQAICYIPFGQGLPYDLPVQATVIGTPSASLVNTSAAFTTPADQNEARVGSIVPAMASHLYPSTQGANQQIKLAHETEQRIDHQRQTINVARSESINLCNEVDDDAMRAQIYKSQPPPPSRPSQYMMMTNVTNAMLSEPFAELQTDDKLPL